MYISPRHQSRRVCQRMFPERIISLWKSRYFSYCLVNIYIYVLSHSHAYDPLRKHSSMLSHIVIFNL